MILLAVATPAIGFGLLGAASVSARRSGAPGVEQNGGDYGLPNGTDENVTAQGR